MLLFMTALLAITTQLPGLYLRYIPFHNFITRRQKQVLAVSYGSWFVLELSLVLYALYTYGISFYLYKFVQTYGWIPYFTINLLVMRRHVSQHIFIFGMQCTYTFLLHSLASFLLVEFMPPSPILTMYYFQTILYLLFVLATINLIKNYFKRIFLAYHDINERYYWRLVCLLPLLICADNLYFSFGKEIVVQEQLVPRLILAACFLLFARCVTLDLAAIQKRVDLDSVNQRLSMQLHSLQEQTLLLSQSQEKISILRHDIRHYNRLLHLLIHDGKMDEVLKLIEDCDKELVKTTIHSYCKNPIINAALSIYIAKAEQAHIKINHKIDLPSILNLDENDLAIVLSNLMENAVKACCNEPAEVRCINLTAKTSDEQIVLLIENPCHGKVDFGTDGLPTTSLKDHGLGMRSLSNFTKKYGATVFCTHENGWFRTIIYVAQEPAQPTA